MDARDRLTLLQLQRFLAVAEDLHFTRAAARLNVSQPLLSAQIRELEEVLGAKLLQRTSRKVELTEAGEALQRRAQWLLIAFQDAVAATREVANGRSLPIRIGYTDEFCRHVLPELVAALKKEDQSARIELITGAVPHLVSSIVEGSTDLALLCPLPAELDSQWRVQMLADAELVVGIRRDHPLAAEPRLTIRDLVDEPFVASTVEDSGSERLADRLFEDRSLTRRIAQRSGDPHLMNSLAAAGIGILFATEADFAPYPELAAIPLDPPVRLTRGAISRSSNQRQLLERAHELLSVAADASAF